MKKNRIYIIGPTGSGKTTLSKILEKQLNIKSYELDKVVFDEENKKRTKEEQLKIFNKIINKNKWIIEDVGREIFNEGLKKSDAIYYLKYPKYLITYRVIKRWIKQRIGLEKYNYYPSIKSLFEMIGYVKSYYHDEKIKLNRINTYKEKVITITPKIQRSIMNERNN